MKRFQISKIKTKKCMPNRDNILMICTIISMVLAVIVAITVRQFLQLDGKKIYCISLPGVVFMNLMKMMILPLLILSLISGLTSLNLSTSRKQGLYSIIYFVFTTVIAVWLGIVLTYIIKPGKNMTKTKYIEDSHAPMDPVNAIVDLFNNIFPDNIFRSTFQQSKIVFQNKTLTIDDGTAMRNKTALKSSMTYTNNPNYLGLIFISIFFGIILNYIGSRGQIIVTIVTVLNDLVMKMVSVILWYMPIGVFFLILSTLLDENIIDSFKLLYKFILTVMLGLLIHMLIVLPAIYVIIVKKNPYRLIKNMARAMMVAFVTQSSSATMPVTIACVDQNLKIDKRVTRFMIPVGAIVNMDGTGLFQAMSAIFISQILGKPLDPSTVFMISMTSTLAAIGAATLPSGGLVTLLIVLSTANLDLKYVTLLYSCDWLLDRCRTAVNILGDAFGCGIIQKLCKEELENDIDINDHFTTNF